MVSLENDVTYALFANTAAFIAAVWDVKTRRIPNLISFTTFVVGLALHLCLDGWQSAGYALLSGVLAGAVFFIFYCAGGMGAGDVKFICAVSSVYGLTQMPSLLVFTSLAGGAMAIALALRHGRLRETLGNVGTIAVHHGHYGLASHPQLNVRNTASLRLPYGVAIAAGCVLVAMGRA